MEIPESFKSAIAKTFYNRELKIRKITTATDAEGGVKKVAGAIETTTSANIAPISAALQQSLLGQDITAEYKITTADNINAEKGSLAEIDAEIYEIVDFKRYESHAELLAKRWVAP